MYVRPPSVCVCVFTRYKGDRKYTPVTSEPVFRAKQTKNSLAVTKMAAGWCATLAPRWRHLSRNPWRWRVG